MANVTVPVVLDPSFEVDQPSFRISVDMMDLVRRYKVPNTQPPDNLCRTGAYYL
jgi:hypothetical protein